MSIRRCNLATDPGSFPGRHLEHQPTRPALVPGNQSRVFFLFKRGDDLAISDSENRTRHSSGQARNCTEKILFNVPAQHSLEREGMIVAVDAVGACNEA